MKTMVSSLRHSTDSTSFGASFVGGVRSLVTITPTTTTCSPHSRRWVAPKHGTCTKNMSKLFRPLDEVPNSWSGMPTRAFMGGDGLSLPSSKSLWDIVKREHLEPHDAKHVHDIWMEVRCRRSSLCCSSCCGTLL